jgi:hypothetical protein
MDLDANTANGLPGTTYLDLDAHCTNGLHRRKMDLEISAGLQYLEKDGPKR